MAARMNQQETRARERRRDNTGLQLLGSRSYVPLGLEAPDNVQELVWTGCGHRWESEQLPTWSQSLLGVLVCDRSCLPVPLYSPAQPAQTHRSATRGGDDGRLCRK